MTDLSADFPLFIGSIFSYIHAVPLLRQEIISISSPARFSHDIFTRERTEYVRCKTAERSADRHTERD
ncbi:hypothetical protein CQP30_12140 [Yersinia pestis]|uniref:Uncharacterized protein n=1 Tax=Yersinia pestis TaxID=632 RepID=A0A3G5LHJ8_YERPE|nr:hypothetical [Yersinia pestis KIM10+]AYW83818.1 hypothetical protein EGX42_13195 [Yersinia pestis]OUY12870.1 hypothetical protein BFI40_17415 [Yersinia pestis subsp. microtus bv. Altaica]OVY75377.1 hypothetical protein BFI50_14015 [Yersinia pestis subsp. microtus bv. Xilingolensis]OVY83477.1 hypothetical protein BFI52_14410 [Yersinia pestis subsp. microtus]QFR86482.1 hypothetical protein DJY80_17190 [Yersinia pestis subsp. pestis bv. Medievalis]